MKLLIVESPTKSKTINNYLGKDFKVMASIGHVRDLPKSTLGVDIENDFEPKYVIPTKARKNLNALKKAAKEADTIYLSTDPDREGEAIAWHLLKGMDIKDYKRITYHEITKDAILNALENPRKIDMNLVNSQQTRRILDRLVGYKLSPLLWKKIAKGLSAGRVQSVALRLICEREKEIEDFKPTEYWSVEADLSNDTKEIFTAKLVEKNGKKIDKLEIENKEQAEEITNELKGAKYIVDSVIKKDTRKSPLPPFTTSTLQQTAASRFRFSSKMTMLYAQKLYEQGLITYHRTDSMFLSEKAIASATDYISKNLGPKYNIEKPRRFKTKSKNAQEAHEAIRPADVFKVPGSLKLDDKLAKLYQLIWQRFVATQVKEALFDSVKADIMADKYTFRANGQTLKFDGFLKVYPMSFKENSLPEIKEKETLKLEKLSPLQHFTEPPPRYTEASLIKLLEEYGIGRPSTYSSIIAVIQKRNYTQKNADRRFEPTEIGTKVNNLLVKHFPAIVDVKFTAKMEDQLDDIADGEQDWKELIRTFYFPFEETLKNKYDEIKEQKIEEKTDKTCPECGGEIVIKYGRFGKFYACKNFPECKHTEKLESKSAGTGVTCPECGNGEITQRKTRKGRIFYSCDKYPACKFAMWGKPTGEKCPKCGSLMMEASKKTIKCSNKECK